MSELNQQAHQRAVVGRFD
jgi:hypothetical protein